MELGFGTIGNLAWVVFIEKWGKYQKRSFLKRGTTAASADAQVVGRHSRCTTCRNQPCSLIR